jgi:uracil-DNA glycosylase family protein
MSPAARGASGNATAHAGAHRGYRSLAALRESAAGCHDCDLWKDATQTVFGEGRVRARLMLVGEQPGDREDREGRPFVGPAGALLDRALQEAQIERDDAYLTNVVKHFKFRARGKRRIHQRPNAEEVRICRQWLDAELALVRPTVLVCLGLVAGHALLGSKLSVGRDRGRLLETELAPAALLTAHPSSVLRERDADARHAALAALVSDLRVASAAC